MAREVRPLAGRVRWCCLGLSMAAMAAAQAQESGALPSDAAMADDGLRLRLTHAPGRPAVIRQRLDGAIAATLAVTAPPRSVSLDGMAPGPAPAVKAPTWHSGLGVTLSGGDRLGLRRADGGLQLVWRRQF